MAETVHLDKKIAQELRNKLKAVGTLGVLLVLGVLLAGGAITLNFTQIKADYSTMPAYYAVLLVPILITGIVLWVVSGQKKKAKLDKQVISLESFRSARISADNDNSRDFKLKGYLSNRLIAALITIILLGGAVIALIVTESISFNFARIAWGYASVLGGGFLLTITLITKLGFKKFNSEPSIAGGGLNVEVSSWLTAAAGTALIILGSFIVFDPGFIGGVFVGKAKTNTTTTTTTPAPATPTVAETCKDKESVATGYKLFYSDTYKYCIQYPTAWPVEQSKADMVTFGTVNPEPTPGWFKVTHFKDKSSSMRTEEIMSNFREPAGPCTRSDLKVGAGAAKKLDCIGSFDGEDHVYVLLGHGQDLFELSYIVGSYSTNTLSDARPTAAQIEAYIQSLIP